MNKGRRQELTQLKFKKRLSQLGLKKEDGNMFAFKSHGKPCSCYLCSPQKYNRAKMKRPIDTGAKAELIHDDNWM